MQCARCHHHPSEVWSQQDYYGLTNFFTRIEKKENGDGGKLGGAKLLRSSTGFNREMWRGDRIAPQAFGQAKVEAPEKIGDVRKVLADWVTDEQNPFFARNWVNRYWAYMMGRGLIEPIDDLRATNPPTMPSLMAALEQDFIEHGYDVRHLIRRICNSRVYQLASVANSERDPEGKFYTHRRYERMEAHVLLDAIAQATGIQENYSGLPAGTRAIELPDPAVGKDFLKAFGQSSRANPCECLAQPLVAVF